MLKKNLKDIVTELENARLQGDRTIRVDVSFGDFTGTRNYLDFRTFCDELIRKIRTG